MSRIYLLNVFTFIFFSEHTCLPASINDGGIRPWEVESFGCSSNWECVSVSNCYGIVDLQDHTAYPCSNYGEPLKICCPPATTISPALSGESIKVSTSSPSVTTKKAKPSKPTTTTTPKTTTLRPSTPANISAWSKLPKELRNKTQLLPTTCGIHVLEDRIIGGNNTEIGQFPWMALIGSEIKGIVQFWCGGTLINKRYVLTAAHCIQVGSLKPTIIRLGEWDVSSEKDCVIVQNGEDCAAPPVDLKVEEMKVHERFGDRSLPSFQNDIALIRVAQDVDFTYFVSPICLHPVNVRSKEYTISGWGVSEVESVIPNPILQRAKVSLFDFNECNSVAPAEIRPLAKSQFCAGGGVENTCKGDSGGPLTYMENGQIFLKGIVSLGITGKCEDDGKPAIYTEVTSYIKWILTNIR